MSISGRFPVVTFKRIRMKQKLFFTAFSFLLMAMASSCHRRMFSDRVFSGHAGELLDSTYKYYGVGSSLLYHETYPVRKDGKVSYLAGDDTVSVDKVAYLWPTSGLFSAVNALFRATGDGKYRKMLDERILPGLMCYYDTTRVEHCYQSYLAKAGHSDRFYDDNIWLGIDFVETYELTGHADYLSSAEGIWRFIESGRDSLLGDGVYWCEQKKFSKNTCSNAPASVLALKLYRATGDAGYLKAGEELYRWTKAHLQDSADYLYFDNMNLSGKIDRMKYQYNSGQMMQAAALLYQITGEKAYLDDAENLAKACGDYFFKQEEGGGYRCIKDGNVWFVAVMLRGFEELYAVDGDARYLKDFSATLDRLWKEGRDGRGLFEDGRFTPSPERKDAPKWLLTQAALIEMYARLSTLK